MKATLLFLTMLFSLTVFGMSGSRTITGTVYDDANLAIPGVTVKIVGTATTVSTNSGGHYSITVPDGKTQLTFSFVGFEVQTVTLGKSDVIDVKMKPSDKSLNEVVVSGYGTRRSKNITRVNGKSYAGGDVQATTQNLPADVLKNIQVVDDYGDQAAITGIKSGAPEKVLNITGKLADKLTAGNGTPEDLLKKLPGVAVDAKGNVTAQGRMVTKVTLNGKNFYQHPYDGNQNESYAPIIENAFLNPLTAPLSTFAVDVDAASYSNFRRFVNQGQLPPKSSVRIEEMINYFHYNLPEPTNSDPVAIHTELSATPWSPQHRLLRIGLKAKNVKMDKLPPSNLVFLIDVSGSMDEANKLPLVKTAMKLLVDQLRPIDNVAIVVYAGEVAVKLESTPGNEKTKIKEVIENMGAGGSTAGGAGIIMAYEIAKQKFITGGNNRIILATDGDFNVGASSDKDMETLISDERQSGVSISILGFGMGNLKDSKMETMADKGHGNYAYIDNITEATKAMVTEFGGTLFTVAKDVKLQIEFNPVKVQAYRLLGYEDRLLAKEDFNNDKKLGGDMGVGHTVTALYEIIPAGVVDSFATSVDPLKYQKVKEAPLNNSEDMVTIKFRYKQPDSDKSKMEQVTVTDKPLALTKTSDDFRFAASVAELGLLLRDSEYKQKSSFSSLISMARSAKGQDNDGYRAEFIRLAESVKLMSKSDEVAVK